jgi:SAM-dependent methyltransferase
MKLSDTVNYLNHLDTLSVHEAAAVAIAEVTKITHTVQHSAIQAGDHAAALISIQENLATCLKQYQEELKKLREGVRALIQQHEPIYFANSTDLYQQGMRSDTVAYILQRTRPMDPATEKLLLGRLITYTDWRYPGMVLRPAHSPGLESLVALDPLYLVDTDQALLDPVTCLFTPEYQRRLRYYTINEYTQQDIFWNLPAQQFGFVYAFRYFEFKPWEVLQKYLDEIFVLLRPGGSLLFSFNDCDHWRAVALTENHFCCYTPGRLIRAHVKKLGFEITYDHNDHSTTSWLELRKPGMLDSIRGAQTLAGVFQKVNSTPEVVDNSTQDLYNELDLAMLIELARVLNVNISEAKTKREFNIKKVRRTISAYLESANYSEEYLRQLFNQRKNK